MVAVGVKPPECSWAALGKVPLSLGTWWPLQQHIRTGQPTQSFQTSAQVVVLWSCPTLGISVGDREGALWPCAQFQDSRSGMAPR